jgi:hypothetical protein
LAQGAISQQSIYAADLAASMAADLAAADQHIILHPTAFITQTGDSNTGLISQSG